MARRIKAKAVQVTLFGEDEIKLIKTKPVQYDAYMQGARDMLFSCMQTGYIKAEYHRVRHLPRRYMIATIERLLSDRQAFEQFCSGKVFTFKCVDDHGRKKIVCDKIISKK